MIELTKGEEALLMVLRTMKKATQERRLDLLPDLNQKLLQAVTKVMTE